LGVSRLSGRAKFWKLTGHSQRRQKRADLSAAERQKEWLENMETRQRKTDTAATEIHRVWTERRNPLTRKTLPTNSDGTLFLDHEAKKATYSCVCTSGWSGISQEATQAITNEVMQRMNGGTDDLREEIQALVKSHNCDPYPEDNCLYK
jgi:hypothetical protein